MRRRDEKLHNRLQLGVFGANCSSGQAVTTVPERWQATWENNAQLAEMADEAGLDFMLPIARWRGYGGASDFQSSTLETITWACGLLGRTRRLRVFGTVHVPLVHPIFAAKQFVTIDLQSSGRFGVNIVCGWNQDEFEMFGAKQLEHDDRYLYADEWLRIVEGVWTSERPFDFEGRFFQLQGVNGHPKPFNGSRPIVMNAAASRAGRAFACRHSDVLFTIVLDVESAPNAVRDIKANARTVGNESLDVFTSTYIVCRKTRSEAEDYHRYYAVDEADHDAVDHLARLQGLYTQDRPPELRDKLRFRIAGGHGGLPLIGTPDDVADQLIALSDAGFAGCTITFVDYLKELPFFNEHVLPRLERAGVRRPLQSVRSEGEN